VDAQAEFSGLHSALEYFPRQTLAFFIYLIPRMRKPIARLSICRKPSRNWCGISHRVQRHEIAMFFMAEYANMVTVACLATLLFWAAGMADFWPSILQAVMPVIWFCLKVSFHVSVRLGALDFASLPL